MKRRLTKLDRNYKWVVRGFFIPLLLIWTISFGWSHYQNLSHYKEVQTGAITRLAQVYGYQGDQDLAQSLNYLDEMGIDQLPYNIQTKYRQGYYALRLSPAKEGLIRSGLWGIAFAIIYGTFDYFFHRHSY